MNQFKSPIVAIGLINMAVHLWSPIVAIGRVNMAVHLWSPIVAIWLVNMAGHVVFTKAGFTLTIILLIFFFIFFCNKGPLPSTAGDRMKGVTCRRWPQSHVHASSSLFGLFDKKMRKLENEKFCPISHDAFHHFYR